MKTFGKKAERYSLFSQSKKTEKLKVIAFRYGIDFVWSASMFYLQTLTYCGLRHADNHSYPAAEEQAELNTRPRA